MLIAVVGTGGFGRVAGVLGGSPAALLRVVAERPDQQVVVLTPDHSLATAQRQADLVAAARPSAQVSVLASAHHALTLTLVADRVLESAPWMTGSADFLGAVRTELSTARSLVWSPSAWRLRGVHLSLGVRFRCLVDGGDPILELGTRAASPRAGVADTARAGWHPRSDDRVLTAGPVPGRLAAQLRGHRQQSVDIVIEHGPYAPRPTRLLTVLAGASADTSSPPDPKGSTPLDPPIDRPRPTTVTQESEAA